MQYETLDEKLARLRAELTQVQEQLIDAEAELADQKMDITAFEHEYQTRVGHTMDQLAAVEAELKHYLDRIQEMRNTKIFGAAHVPVEEQYRRTWSQPPPPPERPSTPPSAATEADIKKLYRKLARRFHPDLASDDDDRAYRTDKMQAINDAYAARSLTELMAIAQEADVKPDPAAVHSGKTSQEMVKTLEKEIKRCRRRLREIDVEMQELHYNPMVELSTEAKIAQEKGRDLLAEFAEEAERRLARKTVELDMIRSQFNNMNPGGGIQK